MEKNVAYLINSVDSQALLTNGVVVKSTSYADQYQHNSDSLGSVRSPLK